MTGKVLLAAGTKVDTVVPIYNEEHVLAQSIERLHSYLSDNFPCDWRIVIADNASTDQTNKIANSLASRLNRVEVLHLERKGRGRALRTAWLRSQADIVSYMDVDLSTDLSAYRPLIECIAEDGFDLAIGCRLAPTAKVVGRRLTREVASRGYNILTRMILRTKIVDAQCGFKAISRSVAGELLPQVVDNEWFFDTELLVRAEKRGFRIRQIPVHWTDDPESHVNIVGTAMQDLKGIWRLKREGF